MASVFERNGRWYLRVKDGVGLWRKILSSARTKTEARRLAEDYERRAERQRLGIEPLPPEDGGGTLDELLHWWLDTFSRSSPYHAGDVSTLTKHFFRSEVAALPLIAVTPARIELFLLDKSREGLAPQTLNHLRGYLSRAFNAARKTGRFLGPNPVAGVAKRKVPRRVPDFLRAGEVTAVLTQLSARWQPLFATAIYAGLRKGELVGLRKTDVDLNARLLTVARSYDRDTTKGGHADRIPIAAELVPYLERAIQASPSEFVFPAPDGSMLPRDIGLEHVLRRALGRAGITTGWRHVCRRQGCGHVENASDSALRRCPKDGRKLWPKPMVRPIRFHDLRHGTASLLMMAGANPAAVQRIMRHSDPKLTTEVYGHLAPEYLRAEVDRLTFGSFTPPIESTKAEAKVANLAPFVPLLSPGSLEMPEHLGSKEKRETVSSASQARQAGLEPTTLGLEGRCSIHLSYWRKILFVRRTYAALPDARSSSSEARAGECKCQVPSGDEGCVGA